MAVIHTHPFRRPRSSNLPPISECRRAPTPQGQRHGMSSRCAAAAHPTLRRRHRARWTLGLSKSTKAAGRSLSRRMAPAEVQGRHALRPSHQRGAASAAGRKAWPHSWQNGGWLAEQRQGASSSAAKVATLLSALSTAMRSLGRSDRWARGLSANAQLLCGRAQRATRAGWRCCWTHVSGLCPEAPRQCGRRRAC